MVTVHKATDLFPVKSKLLSNYVSPKPFITMTKTSGYEGLKDT